MEPAVLDGDLRNENIENFFANKVEVAKRRKKTYCLSTSEGTCEVAASSTSRWEDVKQSAFLLGNAFRLASGKPPEKVKQVKEARVFFDQVG